MYAPVWLWDGIGGLGQGGRIAQVLGAAVLLVLAACQALPQRLELPRDWFMTLGGFCSTSYIPLLSSRE